MEPEFWHGRRVFVTGHSGFKGGWLCLWLQSLGARVTGYALPPPTPDNLFGGARVGDGMESIFGDVRDLDRLARAVSETEPEVVFHLAAQPIVRTSYDEPIETFSTNVMGTAHLLEAVRRCPAARAVVVVTSDKCYENTEQAEPYAEHHPMGGHDPYSSSKGCAELVTSAFRRSYFAAEGRGEPVPVVASVRAGNVIGGGDWSPHRLVPDAVRALGAGRAVEIRSPRAVRPWQHVVNPISGYLLLAQRLCESGHRFEGAWNLGPAREDCRPVSWLIERIVERWGGGAAWEAREDGSFHEAQMLMLDWGKAERELGWRPIVGIETAIDWLVEWYQAYAAGADVRRLTLERIERAQEALVEAVASRPDPALVES